MTRTTYFAALPAAVLGSLLATLGAPALAQTPALTPQIIDITAMTDADLTAPNPPVGTLRSKTLVVTPSGTVALQTGDVPKHMHNNSDEIQYVVAGTGVFWLGNEERKIKAGDLIVIPKGTAHAGSRATDGKFKVIAIKLPPQVAGDTHMLP